MVVHELPNCGIYPGVGVGLVGWGRRDGRVGVCSEVGEIVSYWAERGEKLVPSTVQLHASPHPPPITLTAWIILSLRFAHIPDLISSRRNNFFPFVVFRGCWCLWAS